MKIDIRVILLIGWIIFGMLLGRTFIAYMETVFEARLNSFETQTY